MNGFRATQMLRATLELGIPDLVATDARSAEDLAAATGVLADPLRRTLRALVALGLFAEDEVGRFQANEVSRCLEDRPGSLRGMALMLPGESYTAFAELMHTLKTGAPAFDHVYGMTRWEQLAGDPTRAALFNAAMQSQTEQIAAGVVAAADFATGTAVDVGGGRGTLVAALLRANPQLRGIVYDLEAGLAEADAYLAAQGVRDRCEVVRGDFFTSIPAGHEVYLMKHIVHDWSDDKAVQILTRCREAMPPAARLYLVENTLPARAADAPQSRRILMGDMQMMVLLGGRERSELEFADLLARAGLRLESVSAVSPMSLILARPAH